ncbi:MAG: bifunctional N(6)-L-threonylcarbamoyladenine synthase/serine/threonine protein kinase [Candidatus Diapherotrites archaeon]|nr:bifunctional N(6)-L-threonylcarbamoyladenine synthase/serine/threonine protein kinase [Candidatus Diapherotrites archaeon]
MICLGIESTAHTFSVGIVSDDNAKCNILANEKSAFTAKEGGIHPAKAAEHHFENAHGVFLRALKNAGIRESEIDVVSFAQGPGLGPCLRVGAIAARTLSLKLGKPLVGVNHCVAHVEIAKALTGAKDPITVYSSGANTQIIGYENKRYRVYGETLDIGIGNALDSFGRALGLGFPAGPVLDKMYFEAMREAFVELPYSVKGMDLVFSGLVTAAEQKIGKVPEKALAYSFMHTACAMLCEVAERALAHTEKKELMMTGGVAASRALREMLGRMCEARGAKLFVPDWQVCVDNGAMIAWQGLLEFKAGNRTKISDSRVNQKFRTDDVEVNWI